MRSNKWFAKNDSGSKCKIICPIFTNLMAEMNGILASSPMRKAISPDLDLLGFLA